MPAASVTAARPALAARQLRRVQWLALLLALVMRLLYAWAHRHTPLTFDSRDYVRHAVSLASGHGYPPAYGSGGPTALRPPGYPFLLGGLYWLVGPDTSAARVVQAVIGVGIVALIGFVARELWGWRAGLAATSVAAVYPPFVVVGSALLSEPLFVLFELVAVAAALRHRRAGTPGWRWAAAAGVAAGLAWLTRSTGPAIIVALLLLVAGRQWRTRSSLRATGALLAGAVAVVLPWTLRNAVVMHAFIPVSDQGGYTLAGTYNATSLADGAHWRPAQLDPANERLMTAGSPSEAQYMSRLLRHATHFAEHHPGYVVRVAAGNADRLLQLDGGRFVTADVQGWDEGGPEAARWTVYAFWMLLALALTAAATGAFRGSPWPLWLIPLLLCSVVFVESSTRFRLPIEPFLVLLVGRGLVTATDAGRRRRRCGRRRISNSRGR